jgi:hypothetical protein
MWLGPPLVTLGLAGCGVRLAALARAWRVCRVDLLIGLLVVFVLGYINKYAGWFPKYEVAMAPLLALLGASVVAHAWCIRRAVALALGGATVVVGAAIGGRLVGDSWALQRTWAIEPAVASLLLAALLAAVAIGALLGRVRGSAAAAVATVAGLTLGWALATDIDQVRAPYSTTYWYGTTGLEQAARWIDAHLADDETYIGAKEVAIRAADERYVDQDDLVYFFGSGRGFDGTWAGEPARAAVVWMREQYVAGVLGRGLSQAGFRETARFGDYVVYEPAGSH